MPQSIIIDENLTWKLATNNIIPTGLTIYHCTRCGIGKNPSDTAIWGHAANNDAIVLTKDSDFNQMVGNPPPWLVRLIVGNMKLQELYEFLKQNWMTIEQALQNTPYIQVDQHMNISPIV